MATTTESPPATAPAGPTGGPLAPPRATSQELAQKRELEEARQSPNGESPGQPAEEAGMVESGAEVANQEEEMQNDLQEARRAGQVQLDQIARLLETIKPPNKNRFAIAKFWVIVAEASDYLTIVIEFIAGIVASVIATPAGGFLAWITVKAIEFVAEVIVFDIPLLILLGGENAKNIKQQGKIIENASSSIDRLRTVNSIALKFAKIGPSMKKGVFGRMWKSIGLDKIPIVDFGPWRYLAVRKQEKLAWEAYHMAIEALNEQAAAIIKNIEIKEIAAEEAVQALEDDLQVPA
ncbi:MAG: hypothetical protein A3A33_00680 [Candidatus Yanofskybacteria bacterium RIFCSPLOWO2_01_FULL_49_25]|uniref:Uncharacterized protein n=1 Tax=Candidatus Yanofskybacteria bacterium RIFCSPLOWO2_01_FULL_49_25 TaxID=1802701 RepID=A0A1F8GWK0_9BACT|nr:MAG: hypothetical protein A3A33_00680 [Candidatus Yanofskybacteria bacterium RIFCSPLOWO2_01_FULL_49_25]